jgi:putative ABC transport system ATP-binding protein
MGSLTESSASSVPSATRDATPSISITNLDLSLGTGAARVHILKNISLRIASGEAIGLVGASGSGKSTLLMVMAGLERPDSGEVVVNGTSFNALDEDALARFRGRHVGIVFQSFHLIPTMTALENVSVPLELAGHPDAAARALAPDPAILVADEPTGNLDETTGQQIVDLLFAQHAARGMTMVLVTHDAALAHKCDRVVRLRSGQIETPEPERRWIETA